VTDDEIEKATDAAKKFGSGGGASKAGGSTDTYRRPDGGSRGDDTNRSAAIYLAREIVMGAQDCPATADEILHTTMVTAGKVYNYIKNGEIS
jgi:hypothetical protein